MSDERLSDLEMRYAWLEKQAAERDVEMHALADRLRRLERQMVRLTGKAEQGQEPTLPPPESERPPHY